MEVSHRQKLNNISGEIVFMIISNFNFSPSIVTVEFGISYLLIVVFNNEFCLTRSKIKPFIIPL